VNILFSSGMKSFVHSVKIFHSRYVIDGKYEILSSVDDTYLANGRAFNWQGGQYKLMDEKTVGNLSEMLYNETFHDV
jgi:hypothetical protein